MKKWIVLICVVIVAFTSCAKRTYYSPVILRDLNSIKDQQKKVKSLFWNGKINIRSPENGLSGSIFVIAKRSPLRVKIEISNWLSGPVFYVFIRGNKIWLFSLKERKVYLTTLQRLSTFCPTYMFPPGLDQDQIWEILRGMPGYIKNERALFFRERATVVVSEGVKITYRDYDSYEGIIFAKNINVYARSHFINTSWDLKIEKIQFNKTIPQDIFRAKIPQDFQIIRYQAPSS